MLNTHLSLMANFCKARGSLQTLYIPLRLAFIHLCKRISRLQSRQRGCPSRKFLN